MLVEVLLGVIFLLFLLLLTRGKYPKGFPPGPEGLPFVGYLPFLLPNPHLAIGRLGRKYGSIFRVKLGSYVFVVLNDAAAVKTALKQDVFSGRPTHLLAVSLLKLGIINNEGQSWAEQRRFALKTLRDFGFGKESMEASVAEEVAHLISHLKAHAEQGISIKEMFTLSVLNGLWALVAGRKFSIGEPRPLELLKEARDACLDSAVQGPLYVIPWFAKRFPRLTGLKRMVEALGNLKEMFKEVIDEHKETYVPTQPRDFIDMYLKKVEETHDPTSSFYGDVAIDHLVDALVGFFLAGSDTLTATLEYTLLYLVTFPHIAQRIQAEMDDVVGRARLPQVNDRAKLPYLEAVMQESLRYSSILPGALLHSTLEDTVLLGHRIPKGTIVMPNLHQVHHDRDYWGDPEAFRPERFLAADGECRRDEGLVPFSVGKRVCVAEAIAMTQYFLFLSNILHYFHVRPDSTTKLPSIASHKPAIILCPQTFNVLFTLRT